MVILKKNLKTKSDPNIHQNASNCTIKKKISLGSMPPNPPPLTKRMASLYIYVAFEKYISCLPPLQKSWLRPWI